MLLDVGCCKRNSRTEPKQPEPSRLNDLFLCEQLSNFLSCPRKRAILVCSPLIRILGRGRLLSKAESYRRRVIPGYLLSLVPKCFTADSTHWLKYSSKTSIGTALLDRLSKVFDYRFCRRVWALKLAKDNQARLWPVECWSTRKSFRKCGGIQGTIAL